MEGDEHFHHESSLTNPTRVLALTDGVFAIIMTLLVLELKVPTISNTDLLFDELMKCSFNLLLYFASFLLAGVYWMGHRLIFSLIKSVNTQLVWLNIIFLMICSLIPFGAALLGAYPFTTETLTMYGTLLTMLASWRLLMYWYVTSNKKILHTPVPPRRRRRVISVMLFAPVMFLMSICIVPFLPGLSLILFCVTPVMFVTLITIVNRITHD